MIFDLDGTVVNSEWRTPRKNNGSIDIEKWVGLAIRPTQLYVLILSES